MGDNRRILFVSILPFILFTTHGCPTICLCHYGSEVVTDCSNKNLSTLPQDIPNNTTYLLLGQNNLKDISHFPSIPHLKVLDLQYNQLKKIPLSLFSLQNLQNFWIQNNLLSTLPSLNMPSLRILDISGNEITYMNSIDLSKLPNLEILNVSNNPISFASDKPFLKLQDLHLLDISNITLVDKNISLEGPTNLHALYLNGNELDNCTSFLSTLSNSSQLTVLHLRDNNIVSLENCAFQSMSNLQKLYLDGNRITCIPEDVFNSMSSLNVLSLRRNAIANIHQSVFQSLSSLHSLYLSQMPNLYHLTKVVFNGLRNLLELDLSGNRKLSFIHQELFSDLTHLKHLNISFNNISSLPLLTFQETSNVTLDVSGNPLLCDCNVEWMIQIIQNNISFINFANTEELRCILNETRISLLNVEDNLSCSNTNITDIHQVVKFAIGTSARLKCPYEGDHPPKITWITPRNLKLVYHFTHELAQWDYPSDEETNLINGSFHNDHKWHQSKSYDADLDQRFDRIVILQDGSLYIDYVMRVDSGPYKCIIENPQNKSSSQIMLRLDYQVLMEVKLFSIFVGLACAASFFMLNLVYVFIVALARRCINQRRREAILQFLESFDQYKSNKVSSIRENYNAQVTRIRETYNNRMTKLRENYNTQMTRIREGASHIKEGTTHRVDIIREKYQIKQRKVRDYTSHQLQQLREAYNNQLLKVRDYGSLQLGKLHKKYKLKQKHVMKLLDTMNIDNCKTLMESECVRTESMLFETEEILNTPESASVSSEEYVTASSSSSNNASQENLQVNDKLSEENDNSANIILEDERGDNSVSDQLLQNNTITCSTSNHADECFIEIQMIDDTEDEPSNIDESNV